VLSVSENNLIQDTQKIFIKKFGEGGTIIISRAPGRVNLIGEHTDYNDGFVFPMALDFQVVVAARKSDTHLVRIYSADFDETVEFSIDQPIVYDKEKRWSNYLRGVLVMLQEAGVKLCGMDIAFQGNVPQGSGLSSSAALEVATSIMAQKILGFNIAKPNLAKLCQRAENKFVGMNCGIMDQFISMMGQQGHALFLDCRSLDYQLVPLELGDCRIIICQSGVKHTLVDSEYNKRRQECEQGVAILTKHFPSVKALRDATMDQLEAVKAELDPIVYSRCKHVITEDERVLSSIKALNRDDLKTFGQYMNASHDSLRDDYQVSCPEIDLLVDLAREVNGVLGTRITGGGFGGCTVTLIQSTAENQFKEHITKNYQAKTGIVPQIYISTAANGAEIIG
jgi:galactokinase